MIYFNGKVYDVVGFYVTRDYFFGFTIWYVNFITVVIFLIYKYWYNLKETCKHKRNQGILLDDMNNKLETEEFEEY